VYFVPVAEEGGPFALDADDASELEEEDRVNGLDRALDRRKGLDAGGRLLKLLGDMYLLAGMYSDAIKCFDDGAERCRSVGDVLWEALAREGSRIAVHPCEEIHVAQELEESTPGQTMQWCRSVFRPRRRGGRTICVGCGRLLAHLRYLPCRLRSYLPHPLPLQHQPHPTPFDDLALCPARVREIRPKSAWEVAKVGQQR
jgi:hypothetical protein